MSSLRSLCRLLIQVEFVLCGMCLLCQMCPSGLHLVSVLASSVVIQCVSLRVGLRAESVVSICKESDLPDFCRRSPSSGDAEFGFLSVSQHCFLSRSILLYCEGARLRRSSFGLEGFRVGACCL